MTVNIYGLIGHPVEHSLSPAMHSAAFRELGIKAEYRLFDVEPAELESFLGSIPRSGISGVNITIPHKIRAKEYLDRFGRLGEHARRLGAVNTVCVADDILTGHNTDGEGFFRSLTEDLGFDPANKDIVVIGAGGASTAIVMYLAQSPKSITLFDLDVAKAEELKALYEQTYGGRQIKIVGPADLKGAIVDSQLLVNATPLGMREGDRLPVDPVFLRKGLSVYDLVYNREKTELVQAALKAQSPATNGLGMLLHQGAIAFELWTGRKPPIGVMRKALIEALAVRR